MEVSMHIRMNDYRIELEKGKQSLFGPIYSLDSVELEMLKIYIEIKLVNGFIWLSKYPTKALIQFN